MLYQLENKIQGFFTVGFKFIALHSLFLYISKSVSNVFELDIAAAHASVSIWFLNYEKDCGIAHNDLNIGGH